MDRDRGERIIFPRRGELVVATVKEIVGHGAYLHIEDYNIDGYLPITEVSTKWVRDIEDVIKEGQKIVVKVIRIDRYTNSVDVSYKDVSETEKKKILKIWKKNNRGIKIVKEIEKYLKEKGIEVDLEQKLEPIFEMEDTIYDSLEHIMLEPELLDKVTLKELKKDILEYLSKKIHLKKYIYEAVLSVSTIEKGGVNKIKNILKNIHDEITSSIGMESTEIILIGSPRYKLTTWSYRPESIRKKVLPKMRELAKRLSKNKEVDFKIVEENLKVRT